MVLMEISFFNIYVIHIETKLVCSIHIKTWIIFICKFFLSLLYMTFQELYQMMSY